jgi:hypothetical protein
MQDQPLHPCVAAQWQQPYSIKSSACSWSSFPDTKIEPDNAPGFSCHLATYQPFNVQSCGASSFLLSAARCGLGVPQLSHLPHTTSSHTSKRLHDQPPGRCTNPAYFSHTRQRRELRAPSSQLVHDLELRQCTSTAAPCCFPTGCRASAITRSKS